MTKLKYITQQFFLGTFVLFLSGLTVGSAVAEGAVGLDQAMRLEKDQERGEAPILVSYVRFVHSATTTERVDIYMNETILAESNLSFLESSTYIEVISDTYKITVTPFGEPIENSIYEVENVILSNDVSYTFTLYGMEETLSLMKVTDNLQPVIGGDSRIRGINTADSLGPATIWLLPEMSDPISLWDSLGYGGVGTYLELPPAEYTMGVDKDANGTVDYVFDLPMVMSDGSYNLFVIRDVDGKILMLLLPASAVGEVIMVRPNVRFLHLSPEVNDIDFWLNSTVKLKGGLSYLEGTGFQDIREGLYNFDIVETGKPPFESLGSYDSYWLFDGSEATVLSLGPYSEFEVGILPEDLSKVEPGNVRLLAVHVAYGLGSVDIWHLPESGASNPLWVSLNYRGYGAYLTMASGDLTVGIDEDDDMIADWVYDLPMLPDQSVVNIWILKEGGRNNFGKPAFRAAGSNPKRTCSAGSPFTYN